MKPALLVLAIVGFLPAQVFAQASCNAELNVSTLGEEPFYINEPITISIDLGAGLVTGGTGMPTPNYLDIDTFSYVLDCADADVGDFPDCGSGGNTVVFDAGSLTTDCTDSAGAAINFNTSQAGGIVDFTPGSGLPIRNFSENTCNVSFDVTVTGISGDNLEKEIIEMSGWSSADAQCDNMLTSSAASSVSFNLSTIVTEFRVTKDFSDDNPADVNVHIQCNTGLPLSQDFAISEFSDGVGFIVKSYPAGELDCVVWEEPVPAGYSESYLAGAEDGAVAGEVRTEIDGCHFDDVVNGRFTCAITDTIDETMVTVYKEWVGDYLEQDIELWASASYRCFNVRTDPFGGTGTVAGNLSFYGNDSEVIDGLYPDFDGSSWCTVDEVNVNSAVEADAGDCAEVPVELGVNNECTIYNTVFFEGIPTLSRYGLALMALLMLGTGLLGFRRFA